MQQQYITIVRVLDTEHILDVFLFEKSNGYKPIEESKHIALILSDRYNTCVEFIIYNPTLNPGSLTRVFRGEVGLPQDVELLGKPYTMRRTQ